MLLLINELFIFLVFLKAINSLSKIGDYIYFDSLLDKVSIVVNDFFLSYCYTIP